MTVLTWLAACIRTAEPFVPLPGAQPRDPALDRALWQAADAAPTADAPYVNRLVREASPYLRAHGRDPVDWYPWGDEAFAAAAALDRPVLLSIGYATCHWCHVMADESFRDPAIAAVINARFVAIKVDREVRPDVDQVYLEVVRLMTRRPGGWPMTLVLTPDRKPLFAGSYLPPRDGDRGVSVGFLTVLERMSAGWASERERLEAEAAQTSRDLADHLRPLPPSTVPGAEVVAGAFERYVAGFDAENGGFGSRPKFPRVPSLELLLGIAARSGSWETGDAGRRAQALAMVVRTADAIGEGAVHDVVGGGFHRYAVDAAWAVPHFEKITAENAGIARLLDRVGVASGEARFNAAADETWTGLDALRLAPPRTGFGTARDADSVGPDGARTEGAYYTWTRSELDAALGPELAAFAAADLGVGADDGPIGGRWALDPVSPATDPARRATVLTALRSARATRSEPLLDDKRLASVTGAVLSAAARAAWRDPARNRDVDAMLAVVAELRRSDGRMSRTDGDPAPGVLEDQVYVAEGLLDAFELRGDLGLLDAALTLMAAVDVHHRDPVGGWYATPDDREQLLARPRSEVDGAEPSGAGVAALVALRLAALTGAPEWTRRVDEALAAYADPIVNEPTSVPTLVEATARRWEPPPQIVVAWPDGAPEPRELLAAVLAVDLPGRSLLVGPQSRIASWGTRIAPAVDKIAAVPTVWVCEGGVCQAPATDPAGVRAAIALATGVSAGSSPPP